MKYITKLGIYIILIAIIIPSFIGLYSCSKHNAPTDTNAPPSSLSGIVLDELNYIPVANVLLTQDDEDISTTDQNGLFFIDESIADLTDTICFSKQYYENQSLILKNNDTILFTPIFIDCVEIGAPTLKR